MARGLAIGVPVWLALLFIYPAIGLGFLPSLLLASGSAVLAVELIERRLFRNARPQVGAAGRIFLTWVVAAVVIAVLSLAVGSVLVAFVVIVLGATAVTALVEFTRRARSRG